MKKSFFKNNNLFFLIILFHVGCFVIYFNDPFYGDAKSTISRLAYQIYDSSFNIIFYPKGMDPGHPVTFPVVHAFLWFVFGPHLWLSHILQFLFTIATLFGIYKLDKFFDTKGWLLIIVAINPVFIAMASGLNTHMPLLFFTVLYLNAFFSKNCTVKTIALAALLVTHNQGMLIATVLFGLDLVFGKNIKKSLVQLLALLPWLIWLYLHKNATGWYLFPPEYADFRGVGSAKTLFKNALIIAWRLADFGQFIILILGSIYIYRNYKRLPALIYLLLIALGIIAATWLSVKYSIAHRYFIFAVVLLSIPAAMFLNSTKNWLKALTVVLLISGSFWYYPGKQLADANIQYRQYFKIYAQLQEINIINQNTIYSTPPNESDASITHLNYGKKLLTIAPLNEIENLDSAKVILHGNVCGPLTEAEQALIANWNYLTITSGVAYVNVYFKESIPQELRLKYPPRKEGWFEHWMTRAKEKLK